MNPYNNFPNQNQPWNQLPPQPQPKDYGGFAIASFVIGLVGLLLNFCCIPYLTPILGILSLVFGFISIRSSKKGMAIAGIILGAFTIILSIFVLAGVAAIFGYDGDVENLLDQLFYSVFGRYLY